jgi:hypothetical protein
MRLPSMLIIAFSHVWLFDGAENGKWVQDLIRRELGNREERERMEDRTPSIPDSGASTRFSSPGGGMSNYRKREYLDVNSEEPAMKKVKSEQNLTSFEE